MKLLAQIFSLCLAVALPLSASAQQKPAKPLPPPIAIGADPTAKYLSAQDSIFLSSDAQGRKIIAHPVKPKQTLFSIAKFYSLSLQELYEFNPQFQTDPVLRTGSRVRIPVPNMAIKRYKIKGFQWWKNAPIYYVVQPGETLYKISKRLFAMPVDTVIRRNRLKTNELKPGQLLFVGWLGTEGVPLYWRKSGKPTSAQELEQNFEREKQAGRVAESSGVCFWQKNSSEKGDLYALSREAKIGSSVSVTNPMSRRSVHAKVIGRIPEGYKSNVVVILSPAAARQLGARDPEFFVKMRYFKG